MEIFLLNFCCKSSSLSSQKSPKKLFVGMLIFKYNFCKGYGLKFLGSFFLPISKFTCFFSEIFFEIFFENFFTFQKLVVSITAYFLNKTNNFFSITFILLVCNQIFKKNANFFFCLLILVWFSTNFACWIVDQNFHNWKNTWK